MVFVIITYLLVWCGAAAWFVAISCLGWMPATIESIRVGLTSCAVGAVGGSLYCIRAIYLNKCVYKRWDPDWNIWYFLRPLASCICGGVSFLFLRAGLLVLESNIHPNASEIGFYAFAFVAGLNVDKFVVKIESTAQSLWGIESSRTSKASKDGGETGK